MCNDAFWYSFSSKSINWVLRLLRFSCLSYFVQDTVHDIPSSWNYSTEILRLSSPVAFLITMTALLRYLFILRLHVLDTYSQWERKTSKQDEQHECSFLRLQLSTEIICTYKHLGRSSKVNIKDTVWLINEPLQWENAQRWRIRMMFSQSSEDNVGSDHSYHKGI